MKKMKTKKVIYKLESGERCDAVSDHGNGWISYWLKDGTTGLTKKFTKEDPDHLDQSSKADE